MRSFRLSSAVLAARKYLPRLDAARAENRGLGSGFDTCTGHQCDPKFGYTVRGTSWSVPRVLRTSTGGPRLAQIVKVLLRCYLQSGSKNPFRHSVFSESNLMTFGVLLWLSFDANARVVGQSMRLRSKRKLSIWLWWKFGFLSDGKQISDGMLSIHIYLLLSPFSMRSTSLPPSYRLHHLSFTWS